MPRLKLNDRAIERLPANGRQTLYWDTAMPGFGVLVSSTTRTFVCKSRGIRKALGRVGVMTLDEARDAARVMLRDLTAGIDPRQEKAAGLTLGEAFARYLKAHDLSPRTQSGYADTLRRYFADWSPRALKDITREMVEARHRTIAEEVEARHTRLAAEHHALHLKRAKQVAKAWPEAAQEHRAKAEAAKARETYLGKASANAAMRILRAVYNYAADRDPELPRNPVRLKRQWHRVAPREGTIKPGELPGFYQAVMALESPIGRDYLLLILFTGLRRSEAASLRWGDIDLDARTITVPAARTKAKRKLELPLTGFVHDLLVARRSIGRTKFIFVADSASGHLEEPRYFLDQVAASSGIKVSVHDLRRTYVTVAESCDISAFALRALVNHAHGTDVTSGYVQLTAERLREPAQKVADKLKQLCGVVEVPGAARLRRD